MKKTIAVLITVYNRKEITLAGLQSLYNSIASLKDQYVFDIYLVDDGSKDGTYEAIKNRYPNIYLIKGNGNLYWSRGTNLAWRTANNKKDYDYYLWFNDDSQLYIDSINHLIHLSNLNNDRNIICGAFEDDDKNISYGGSDKSEKLIAPKEEKELVFMNGNLVIIPRFVFQKIGYIDNIFIHGGGDYDYGIRARKHGIKLILSNIIVGKCNRHDKEIPPYLSSNLSLIERFKWLYSDKYSAKIKFIYNKRAFGLLYAIKSFIKINIYTLFPSFIFKIRQKRS